MGSSSKGKRVLVRITQLTKKDKDGKQKFVSKYKPVRIGG